MVDSLLTHVLIASFIGGVSVGSATSAARKYYSGIGGLIGGLPTISSLSLFFIGLNQSPEEAAQASTVFPLGMSITFLFLAIYASLSKHGFKIGISSALLAWIILASIEVNVHLRNLPVSLFAVSGMFIFSLYVFRSRLKLPYARGSGGRISPRDFFEYAILGGASVGVAVYSSQVLGSFAGGIVAAVPAIFSLTLTFTYLSEGGLALSRSVTKPLMISAFTVALPYSMLVGLLYPILGLYQGTVVALLGDVPFLFLAYFLIHKNRI